MGNAIPLSKPGTPPADVDHTKGAKGPVEHLDSDTPPQAAVDTLPAGAVGGAFDPNTEDPVEKILGAPPAPIPPPAIAGAQDYKEKQYSPGPAPGDRVVV